MSNFQLRKSLLTVIIESKMPFGRNNQLQRRPQYSPPARRVIPIAEVAQVSQVEVGVVWVEGGQVNVAVITETALEYAFLGLVV
jgi:hypothetical protein